MGLGDKLQLGGGIATPLITLAVQNAVRYGKTEKDAYIRRRNDIKYCNLSCKHE
jgi:hypothetical protein